jgi:hypothetical protein
MRLKTEKFNNRKTGLVFHFSVRNFSVLSQYQDPIGEIWGANFKTL